MKSALKTRLIYILGSALLVASTNAAVTEVVMLDDNSLLTQQVGWQVPQQHTKMGLANEAYSNEEIHLSYRLLKPLARQGNVQAQYRLASLYDSGHASYASASKAVYWYQKAASNGHRDAQHNLAVAYANGDGVSKNISKALFLWKRAAIAGHTDAQYNLGVMYATGKDGVDADLAEAAKWWRMASKSGDAMAQYNLAALYANGIESVRSYCEATRWWEKSAENGFVQASVALQVIKQKADYSSCWQ